MALGLGFTSYEPGLGLYATKTLAETVLDQAIPLNDVPGGMTFTRATERYCPYNNILVPPGTRCRRPASIGRFRAFGLDLIEGPRTNLLAAGSSDRLTSGWTPNAGAVAASAQTLPDGSLADGFTEDGTTAGHFIMQTVTKAASSLPYAMQFLIKQNAANARPIMQATMDDNAGNGVFLRFNLATGAFNTSGSTFGAGWSAAGSTVTVVNGWYLLTLTGTSNTATTLRVLIQSNSSASYLGDGVSGWYASHIDVEQAAFPSSYISNRNLLTNTEQFDNAAWNKIDITVSANTTLSPFGTLTADTITEGVAGTAIIFQNTAAITAGSTLTDSIYVKAGNTTWVWISLFSGGSNGPQVWLNTSTGVLSGGAQSGTGTYVGSSVVAAGNGFWRVTLSGKVDPAATVPTWRVASASASGTTTRVNNATYILYGAQVEYGTTATAYWGVNATVGGRDQDVLTSAFALSTTSGTLLHLCIPYGWTADQDGATAFKASDSFLSGVEKQTFKRSSATQSHFDVTDSVGFKSAVNITTNFANGVLSQQAGVWDSTSVRAFLNGAAAGTPSAAPTLPFITTDTVNIGQGGAGTQAFYGWVLVLYWSRALSAAELQAVYNSLPVLG